MQGLFLFDPVSKLNYCQWFAKLLNRFAKIMRYYTSIIILNISHLNANFSHAINQINIIHIITLLNNMHILLYYTKYAMFTRKCFIFRWCTEIHWNFESMWDYRECGYVVQAEEINCMWIYNRLKKWILFSLKLDFVHFNKYFLLVILNICLIRCQKLAY